MNEAKKPPLTWDDIEANLRKTIENTKGADDKTDPEKLEAFRRGLLSHLDKQLDEPVDCSTIKSYSRWADTINEKVIDFHNERGVYPNILLANSETFDKIDKYCKKHPESLQYDGEGTPPEFTGLSSFVAADYELEFCMDNEMGANAFRLVYDDSPDFGGEDIPKITKTRLRVKLKRAA